MKYATQKIAGITLILSLLVILAFWNNLFDTWQEKVFDKFFIAKKPLNDIIIFAVDNESIAKIGQWPWSRSVFADAVLKLSAAKVIGIDVNFSEPSAKNPEGDINFSKALTEAKPKVVLPIIFNKLTEELVEPLDLFKKASFQGVVNVTLDEDGTVRTAENVQQGLMSFNT